ncbi:hypothetical protein [Devosia sp. FJ2-5-3]|uniref:hypothetical protein n=1 Tax=Devosia sp. FJ2-5-3 TaxID=2976680 RepID=UPI0023D81F27|nr:hypothetical protein [Devosia sp. FJ2-5-3]WEJ56890.1 hypothetical protein N0P34_11750 [Devosia sp. FJ2-5-3]
MLTLAMSLLTACAALADEAKLTFAGDTFAAGQSSSAGTEVQRDAFVAGFDVKLGGSVGGDAHMAGFNVDANSPVGGDLYAAGFNVKVAQPVGGDLTAMGNDVTVESGATIGGNARLSGAQVTVAGQITGAALIAADTLMLNTPVQGDFEFFGKKIEFGPKALLAGTVSVHAPAPIDIPASVASADRIRFEALETTDYAGEAGKTAEHVVRGVWPAVWAVGVWWASLAVVGTLIIALLPRAASALENKARTRSWATIGLGLVGFAAVLGMVPAAAFTLIGIILLPALIVCAAVMCILAYLAGVYLVGARTSAAFISLDTVWKRFAVLVGSIILAGLIGMLPVLGWLISLLLLIFGFGVVVRSLADRTREPRSRTAPSVTSVAT